MISLLTEYLNRELFKAYLLMTGVLVSLFTVFALINELEDVGDGNYGILDALFVVVLMLPSLAMDLAPFGIMLGAVYGLSVFARHHELVAIRAAGFSPLYVALRTLVSTVLFILLLTGLEFVARPLNQDAVMYRLSQTSPDGQLLSRSGFWYAAEGKFANVGALRENDEPSTIRIFEFDGRRLIRYRYAESAITRAGDGWALQSVVDNQVDLEGTLQIQAAQTLNWSPLWRYDKQIYELPLASLSLVELQRESRARSGAVAELRSVEFWRRALLPLTCLAYALFAAPFALARAARGGLGVRLALGVFAMLGLFLAQQIGINTALLAGVMPAIAVAVPSLLIIIAALFTLVRLR